ncbi:hypothetical protein PRIPAC_89761 [Pristionchus pacificus]|uniref:Uncharacterized protein n=1 Tax=Pristionchus pacificus TaxID=54126 RepID=A0A2A6CXR7_PRIPA|nr:hypothetical protein PRIPAC_89761 [Pristionchus pacificus]|eukprot:PDM82965.1 hypothetical protein PRIPAC_37358 [Pristionchus pacificus]
MSRCHGRNITGDPSAMNSTQSFDRLPAGCCKGGGDNTPATPGREQKERTCVQRCFASFHVSLIGAHCFLTLINAAFLFTHVSLKKIETDKYNNVTDSDYLTKEPNAQIITAVILLLINIITLIVLTIPFCVNNRKLTKFALAWCAVLFAGSIAAFICLRNSLDVYTTDTLLLSTALLAIIEGVSMFLKYFYQGCCSDTPSADVSTARSEPSSKPPQFPAK